MISGRIAFSTYHSVQSVNVGGIKGSSFYFAAGFGRFLQSGPKMANRFSVLTVISDKIAFSTYSIQSMNLSRIQERSVYFVATLSRSMQRGRSHKRAKIANQMRQVKLLRRMIEPLRSINESVYGINEPIPYVYDGINELVREASLYRVMPRALAQETPPTHKGKNVGYLSFIANSHYVDTNMSHLHPRENFLYRG